MVIDDDATTGGIGYRDHQSDRTAEPIGESGALQLSGAQLRLEVQ